MNEKTNSPEKSMRSVKILSAPFFIGAAMGVGELIDKIELMMNDL